MVLLLVKMGSGKLFAWTGVKLYASQLARIVAMSHLAWLFLLFLETSCQKAQAGLALTISCLSLLSARITGLSSTPGFH
jgi:hypothetical protein